MRMGIVTFQAESRTFKFKEPLMLETEYVEGGVCLTHKELGLSARGKTFGECDKILRAQLAELWGGFALTPDKELKGFAFVKDGVFEGTFLALKNKLLAMADEVK